MTAGHPREQSQGLRNPTTKRRYEVLRAEWLREIWGERLRYHLDGRRQACHGVKSEPSWPEGRRASGQARPSLSRFTIVEFIQVISIAMHLEDSAGCQLRAPGEVQRSRYQPIIFLTDKL